jgi:hypothetical protein
MGVRLGRDDRSDGQRPTELNGTSRPVTVTVSGRRDGTALQVAGSIPVTFSTWDITGPSGYGFLPSLANHGVAEFLLNLHHG